jgi:hypothetical protein
MARILWFVVLLAWLVASPALAGDSAEPRRFGNVIFQLPAGWDTWVHNEGEADVPVARLQNDDDDADDPDVLIALGEPFSGDTAALQAWAAKRLNDYCDADERFEPAGWKAMHNPTGARILIGGGRIVDAGDGDLEELVVAAVFRAGDRAELIFVRLPRREAEVQAARASTLLSGHVESLAFVSLGAKPLLGAPTPGPYEGLWWGSRLDLVPEIGGGLSTRMSHATYTFRRDGTFYDGIPPGGIHDFDPAALAMTHTQDVGHYHVVGDIVQLRYASGETDELDITDSGGLQDGGRLMFRVRVPPDGFRFAGARYTVRYTPLAAGIGESAGVSSSSTMRFARDGTFGRRAFTSVTGHHEHVSYHTQSDSADSGTYHLRGGELTLRFGDGKVWTWDCFILDGDGSDPTLWVAGKPIELADGYTLPPAQPATNPLAKPRVNPLAKPKANPLAR